MAEEFYSIKALAARAGEKESRIRKLIRERKLAISRDSPKGAIRVAWSDWERCHRRLRIPALDDTVRRGSVRDLPGADRFLD